MKERFWELAHKAMVALLVAASIAFVSVVSTRLLFGWYPVVMTPASPPGYSDHPPETPQPTAEQKAQTARAEEVARINALACEIDVAHPAPYGE